MIMYKRFWNKIEACEVIRVTDKQVVVPCETAAWSKRTERREAKDSGDVSWHETWDQAHARLVGEAAAKVEILERQLEYAKIRLSDAKTMTRPAVSDQ